MGLKPEHITFLELTSSVNEKRREEKGERAHATVPITIILRYNILAHREIETPMENKVTKISRMLLADLERN